MVELTLESMKMYFWYFFGLMGVVFFWTGVWDGVGGLPYLSHPLISLMIGLIMLLVSGLIFKEKGFRQAEVEVSSLLHKVWRHPHKEEFHIKYHDHVKKKDTLLRADNFKKIEKGFVVMTAKNGEERFIPLHRIKEVLHKGKAFWKY